MIIALYRDLSTGLGKNLVFHVKLFDKKAQKFIPTPETYTACGLQRFFKYGQTDSKILYNVSRGRGQARFVARETTTFFVKSTIL